MVVSVDLAGRTMRMKQAKVEADEEIKVFRAQLEKEVSDMASAVRSLSHPPVRTCERANVRT